MAAEDKKVAILMATYNGEQYLSEQLESIMTQTYQNFTVYVRDDGSNDRTIDILKDYQRKNNDKIQILGDPVLHRGARDGFMWLLQNVDSEYYMFCDQDDVWLPNKIELSINKLIDLEIKHPNVPIMVHTDLELVDSDLKLIWPSFWNWRKFNVDLSKHFCFAPFGNVFTGCTMIINNPVKQICFPMTAFANMHDEWIGLVVAKHGIVDNIKDVTIKYRQHGHNVCSTGQKRSFKITDALRRKNWYAQLKPLLEYLGYGSKFKAYVCKFVYSVSRRFYHN